LTIKPCPTALVHVEWEGEKGSECGGDVEGGAAKKFNLLTLPLSILNKE